MPGAEWASGAIKQLKTNFWACEITLSLLLTYLNLQLGHPSDLPVSHIAARHKQYNPMTLHSMNAGLTSLLGAEWHGGTGARAALDTMAQPHLDMPGAWIHSSSTALLLRKRKISAVLKCPLCTVHWGSCTAGCQGSSCFSLPNEYKFSLHRNCASWCWLNMIQLQMLKVKPFFAFPVPNSQNYEIFYFNQLQKKKITKCSPPM